MRSRAALLLAAAALLATGCYTDPATGRLVFGRGPKGPTPEQVRMQRLEIGAQLVQTQKHLLRTDKASVQLPQQRAALLKLRLRGLQMKGGHAHRDVNRAKRTHFVLPQTLQVKPSYRPAAVLSMPFPVDRTGSGGL